MEFEDEDDDELDVTTTTAAAAAKRKPSLGGVVVQAADDSDDDEYDLDLFADAETQAEKRRKMEIVDPSSKRKQQQSSSYVVDEVDEDDYDEEEEAAEEEGRSGTLFSEFEDDEMSDGIDSLFGSAASSSSSSSSECGKRKRSDSHKQQQQQSTYPNMSTKWVPCIAPDIDAVYKALGKPRPKRECFGCKRGTMNMASQNYEGWNQLMTLWNSSIVFADAIELSRQCEAIYEEQIRRPSDKHRPMDKEAVGEWDAATIYAHFTEHILEPVLQHVRLLRRITDMTHNFITWQMYEENTGEPEAKRVRVPKEKGEANYIGFLKQLVDLQLKLSKCTPEKHFLAQREFRIIAEKATLINHERPLYARGIQSKLYG